MSGARCLNGTDTESTSDDDPSVNGDRRNSRLSTTGKGKTSQKGFDGGRSELRYDPKKLSSSRLLLLVLGTVLSNWVLWAEQLLVVITYFLFAYISETFLDADRKIDYKQFADELRSMKSSMSSLAAFLLGFYTSLTIARWWRLRTDGIGSIWSSSSELCMILSECVTRDEQALTSILRYARASLIILFLQRRHPGQLTENLYQLVDKNVLTEEEVQKLKEYNNNLAESIWTWVLRIVMNLHRNGDIKSERMLNLILEKVMSGRKGAATIAGQLDTPIPLPYVHLLGFLVKVHNYSSALCAGFLLAAFPSEWPMLTAQVFLVPFLYNSILLINSDLADPCDGGGWNEFPLGRYESGIDGDGRSYLQAGKHTPEWMQLSTTSGTAHTM